MFIDKTGIVKTTDSALDEHYIFLLDIVKAALTDKMKAKYNFLHLGYLHVIVTPLFRKALPVTGLIAVLDGRHKRLEDAMISAVQSPLSNGAITFTLFPNYNISISDPYFLEALTMKVKTEGLHLKNQAGHLQISYHLICRLVNTTTPIVYHNFDKLQSKDNKGDNVILQADVCVCSNHFSDYHQLARITTP